MSTPSISRAEVRRRIAELGPWFHNLELAGERTAPDHFLGDYPGVKWARIAPALPTDLTGNSVLDIGCNAGFYSIEMKRRGAERVVGIDSDPRYLEQARLAAQVHGVELELHQMSVYDVPDLQERFDLVLFMGVFYHLRYPLLALDLVVEHALGGLLVFQSMLRGETQVADLADDYAFEEQEVFSRRGFPRMHFVEKRYADDPTNWWIPNRACVEAMLRSAGLHVTPTADHETYCCVRAASPTSTGRRRDDELRRARRAALAPTPKRR
jgi:tRNA (mo5U34)-methyltransferase